MTLTPAIRAFADDLGSLVERKMAAPAAWPQLDADRVGVVAGAGEARIVLAHRTDRDRSVEIEVDDRRVVVGYGPERITFTRPDEALRFVEMLGDGRVELHVDRSLGVTRLRSHRDGLALPFHRSVMPWWNVRRRSESVRFGFDR